MTIRELKEMLEDYDEDMEVVFLPYNSKYVYSPVNICTYDIRKFYGGDTTGIVIDGDQVGSV